MTDFNPLDLSGHCVLVTGASSGIGRAIAQVVAKLGGRVVGIARNQERLQETLRSLEGTGHLVRSFDLAETDAIPGLVCELAKEAAPFSGLVHCAGLEMAKPLRVISTRDFESTYRIHVVAAGMLLRGIGMRQALSPNGCSCIMIGSVYSLVSAAGMAAYGSAKTALLGLVRSAALELARNHIRVNAILCGMVLTEMIERSRALLTGDQAKRLEEMHPLGPGQPVDVANAAAFLLADTARWITGSYLVLDGGYTAQ
jgi:NAD(P)-dependent dehydrogenase (short-subunit alcohol dehydrogenase family)